MRKRAVLISLFAVSGVLLSCGFFLWATAPAPRQLKSLSEVIDAREPYTILAIAPDVGEILNRLQSGRMNEFLKSPLGSHLFRSVPLRGAAHLHRLVAILPEAWRGFLYSWITKGPIIYRSNGNDFLLVVAIEKAQARLASLKSLPHAQEKNKWLYIASSDAVLQKALAYADTPRDEKFPIDEDLRRQASLTIFFNGLDKVVVSRSLSRALVAYIFKDRAYKDCRLRITPGDMGLALDGECNANTQTTTLVANNNESLTLPESAAYIYYTRENESRPYILSLGGLESEYGNLVPRLIFSGPATDQKSVEFLSQAFKTKTHAEDTQGSVLRIRYPHAYYTNEKRYDIFSPHLSAVAGRFFWQSTATPEGVRTQKIDIETANAFVLVADIDSLVAKSTAALKQIDAVYSSGHFNEFRDALFKSLPALKNSSLRFYGKRQAASLRLGGELSFRNASP